MFLFGELPYITGLYERARSELEDDEDLQLDGVKELLIAAQGQLSRGELKQFARRITPLHLSKVFAVHPKSVVDVTRRMTPDLITIVTAAQQIMGDQYALHVAQLANQYSYANAPEDGSLGESLPVVQLGIDQARLPDGDVVSMVNRLPGPPICWRNAGTETQAVLTRKESLEVPVESVHPMQLPAGRRTDRELSHARLRPSQSDCRQRLGADRKVHHQRQGRHRYPRHAATLV